MKSKTFLKNTRDLELSLFPVQVDLSRGDKE